MKNNIQKQEHTHVKNLKRQLISKDFLWRLKLHVGKWKEWPPVITVLTLLTLTITLASIN